MTAQIAFALDTVPATVVNPAPAQPVMLRRSIQSLVTSAVEAIKAEIRDKAVAVIGSSWGKDSSVVVGLTLEAARQLKAEGISKRVVILTSDTLVENPSVIKLAHRMSAKALAFGAKHELDVTQKWVQPEGMDHYLVTMIGGRSVASVAGTKATCTSDLKIKPMDRVRRELAKEFGAENIITLIGTRFDESVARGAKMRGRGESATRAIQQASGSWMLSPIADWVEGDVWAFLNASPTRLGMPDGLDYTLTLALYETIGESTCSIGAIDPQFAKSSAGSCGSGRTGCWACQKVSSDHSLEAMLDRFPAYAPLVRFSKVIRAGHHVPGNRSYLSKSIDSDGTIRVFANGYSAGWTEKLLKWAMTIDAREDSYSISTGKPRRFARLLEPEHLVLIAFMWARYGLHKPGTFIRTYEAIQAGARFDLPTDAEIDALQARSDKKMIGKVFGRIDLEQAPPASGYKDQWRDYLSGLASFDSDQAPCAVPTMELTEKTYTAGNGVTHDAMLESDGIEADLSDVLDPDGTMGITFYDFMWWWSMEFSDGRKTSADEMDWLVREGLIRARRGYQSQLAKYHHFSRTMANSGLGRIAADLNALLEHPKYHPNTQVAQPDQMTLV